MRLLLLVVIDAHEKEIARVLHYFCGILFALYLVDGGVGIMVVFQLKDDGRGIYILTGNEHQVSKALARGELSVDNIVVAGIEIGDGEHTG